MLIPSHISSIIREYQKKLISAVTFIPAWAFDVLVPLLITDSRPEIPVQKIRLDRPFCTDTLYITGRSLYLGIAEQDNLEKLKQIISSTKNNKPAKPPFELHNGIFIGNFTSEQDFSITEVIRLPKSLSLKKAELAILDFSWQEDADSLLMESTLLQKCSIVCC